MQPTIKYGQACASLEETYSAGLPRIDGAEAPMGVAPSTTIQYVNNTDYYLTVKERNGFSRTLKPNTYVHGRGIRGSSFTGLIIWVTHTLVPKADACKYAEVLDNDYKGLGRSLSASIKPRTIVATPGESTEVRVPYFIPIESILNTRGLYYRTLDLYIEAMGGGDGRPHPFLITENNHTVLDGVDYYAAKAPYVQRIRYIDNTLGANKATKYINVMGKVFPVDVEADKERESGVYITHKSQVCADYENIDETYFYALDSELVCTYFYDDSTSAAREGSLASRKAREAEERKDELERNLTDKRLELEELKLAAQRSKIAEAELNSIINREREERKTEHENTLREHQLEELRLKQAHEADNRAYMLKLKELEEAQEETKRIHDLQIQERQDAFETAMREAKLEHERIKAERSKEEIKDQKELERLRKEREDAKELIDVAKREAAAAHDELKAAHERSMMAWQKERARLDAEAKERQMAHEEAMQRQRAESEAQSSKLRTQRDTIGLIGGVIAFASTVLALFFKFRRA